MFLGQTRRAAANAITDGIMRAPVVFLLGALEAQAITMTVSVSVAWPGTCRRGKHKCGGGREKEYVSHSQHSGGYLFTVRFPEMVTEMIDRARTPVSVGSRGNADIFALLLTVT